MAEILTRDGKVAGPQHPIQAETPLFVVRDTAKHEGERRLICRTCVAMGKESVFFLSEMSAFESHAKSCAARYEAELRGRSLRVKAPALFDPEQSGDVEFGKWMRKHRKEILEGRVKP